MKTTAKILLTIYSSLFITNICFSKNPNIRTEFEKQFLGKEWVLATVDLHPYTAPKKCRYTGGYSLETAGPVFLSVASFQCSEGRKLILLDAFERFNRTQQTPYKVLDALLLPALNEGEEYLMTGECSLNGETKVVFHAIANLNGLDYEETVDWQTGVRAAWIPNIETKRFEPLPIRHVVCGKQTPP